MATSTLPSQGPKSGQQDHTTSALSGVPPTPSAAIKIRNSYLTATFSEAQKWAKCILHFRGSPTASKGMKKSSGYITLAVSGVPDAKQRDQNHERDTSALPS